ncbi:TolC family outer membrane protein [Porphyrobacter sp. ULC335]|uniref:TolC family outer membrane protein n=1 Tax=Porphyrobacter sp. ULC335 TaxID=2854260 RepID=UPI00222107EA|nr:TolC family outer membrane protein [Porphyrobacter sp. ULC335]UYV16295.1 TolC family outer membrane protein [Porphyrobacter sp. ULC335]
MKARNASLLLAGSASLLTLTALAAPAHADNLREALAKAYNTNPTLESARANQRATDEGVPISRAPGLPSANITATHIEFIQQSANAFTAPDRNLGVNAQVLVPVYSGGAVRNGIAAAKERVEAGQADLRNTESTLFAQVVAAYMDVLRTEALVALATNNVAVLRTNLEATSDRFQIGDLTITDVAQSRSRLAVAEGDLQSAEANLIAARETYIRLVGNEPGELEAPPPLPGLPDTVGEAIVAALDNNPNLDAAKQRAEAAGFDTKVAGAGRLPTVNFFVNGDYSDFFGTLGGSLANQVDPNNPTAPRFAQSEKTANAGVRVTIPLFQGGLPAARQRQAGARESAALEDVIASERQIIAETRSTYSNWQAANGVIRSAQAAVEAAELSLEGVRAENSIGNRQILDVLNAEQELVNARAQLVTARRNAYVAGFNLLALMGRAEARDLNLDSGVLYDPTINADRVSSKMWDWDRDPEPAPKSTRTVDIPPANATIGPQLLPGE